jgi:hypothetical protein
MVSALIAVMVSGTSSIFSVTRRAVTVTSEMVEESSSAGAAHVAPVPVNITTMVESIATRVR